MSHVADMILAFEILDEINIPLIDAYFVALGEKPPIHVQGTQDRGGRWAFQHIILAGAYNYLDIPKFVDFLETLEWAEPQYVQLLIKDEHDEPAILTDRIVRERLKSKSLNEVPGTPERMETIRDGCFVQEGRDERERCPKPATGPRTIRSLLGLRLYFAPADDGCKYCDHCGEHIDKHGTP